MSVPHTVESQRRAELAAFLRSRRALVSPEDAGLPTGPRRRTPGLRREEVAQLASVGVTWYTWLEQGRRINVSARVLDAVATALRLDRTEHSHLYRLADMPEVQNPPSETAEDLSPDLQTVLDALAGIPACVYNGRYDVLACNAAFAALFPALAADDENRNALWYACTHRDGENPLGSEECLARMVARLRSTYAHHIGEPAWTTWIERLSSTSALFASLWASNQVSTPMPVARQLPYGGSGAAPVRTISFAVTGAPEMRMVLHVPVPSGDVDPRRATTEAI